MAALLGAAIPIPQALEGLGEEEENPALKRMVLNIADSVRKGVSLSASLSEHPRLFGSLYVSMVRVGEEAGVLPKVVADLANLLEHEDEVRSEVVSAVAYPLFVLGFGVVTVVVLLTVVFAAPFLDAPGNAFRLTASHLDSPAGQWVSAQVLADCIGRCGRGFGRGGAGIFGCLKGPRRGIVSNCACPSWVLFFARLRLVASLETLGTLVKSGVSLLPRA